jgi:hypothetical protein
MLHAGTQGEGVQNCEDRGGAADSRMGHMREGGQHIKEPGGRQPQVCVWLTCEFALRLHVLCLLVLDSEMRIGLLATHRVGQNRIYTLYMTKRVSASNTVHT